MAYEKKLRYFVIGEDCPVNKTKIVPCGQFGITEVEVETKSKIQPVKPVQKVEKKSSGLNETIFGISKETAENFV